MAIYKITKNFTPPQKFLKTPIHEMIAEMQGYAGCLQSQKFSQRFDELSFHNDYPNLDNTSRNVVKSSTVQELANILGKSVDDYQVALPVTWVTSLNTFHRMRKRHFSINQNLFMQRIFIFFLYLKTTLQIVRKTPG